MGGSSKKVTVGYKYYVGMHMVLCHGPVDKITRIRVDERTAWSGSRYGGQIYINQPSLFGGESREGGVEGVVDFETGRSNQMPNSYLASKLGPLVPAFRGVVGVVLRQVLTGLNPYLKKWDFRVQRIHTRQNGMPQWYDEKAEIRVPGKFKQTQSFLFALDVSGSMGTIVSGGQTRLDIAKASINRVLDDIDRMRIDSEVSVSVAVCLWGTSQTTLARAGVTSAGILELKAFVNSAIANGGTNFEGPFISANGFFDSNLQDGRRRSMFFITDGEPSPLSSLTDALNIGGDIIDQSSGQFSVARGTEINVYGINIDLANIEYTQQIDNTHNDGVPVVNSLDSEALYNAVFFSVMGDSSAMNPAHIIRECLTDPLWGMGYLDSDIDDASFMAAADTLFAENMGISILWDSQTSIEEFIKVIVKHIDAVVYVDRFTGKFTLKLIRNDYNEALLITLDEDNIEKITDFKRPAFGELTNSITVSYWNNETGDAATISVQDIALAQQQGAIIGTSITYEGFCESNTASRVAQRDLRSLSTPLVSCTIYANRDAAVLNIGDCFKLTWPDYEVENLVMRVTGIAYGDGISNRVRLQCVQDVFSYPDEAFIVEPPSGWENPEQPPLPIEDFAIFEVPYLELVQRQGQVAVDSLLEGNPEGGYVAAGVVAPQSGALSARLYTNNGNGYEDASHLDFGPGAKLAEDIDQMQTIFEISDIQQASDIELGTWLQMGTELMGVEDISTTSITVKRGVLDTVPVPHTAGEALIFWDAYAEADPTEYVAGEEVAVKLLTITGSGELLLSVAPETILPVVGRAYRPYPPGDFKINNQYFPDSLSGPLSVTWASRNRVQQTGGVLIGFTDGPITPEAGTTYKIYAYNNTTNELKYSATGIEAESHIIGVGSLTGLSSVRIELFAERDGFESFQNQVCAFEWASGENLMIFEDNYTPDEGDDILLQFTEQEP